MMDDLLAIGSGFDWITPLWGFLQDVHYGRPYQINIDYDCGWSANKNTKALQSKGIRCWGVMVVGRTITFTVRKPQSRYALYWLRRWGLL